MPRMHCTLRPASLALVGAILAILAFTPVARAAESALLLAEQGRPRAAIVIKDDAALPPLAAFLEDNLFRISGAHLPVLTTKKLGKATVSAGRLVPQAGKVDPQLVSFILLGENGLTRELGVATEGLGAGGIRIKSGVNTLVLLGMPDGKESPGGNVYAINQFLEQLGCRWLWPGESGRIIPAQSTLAVAPLDITYTPPLGQRHIRFARGEKILNLAAGLKRLGLDAAEYRQIMEKAGAAQPGGGDWARWQCLGGDLGLTGGHNGAGLGRDGWEKYGKTHPEWFALQADGTRDQTGSEDRWRLCVSNLELIETVSAKIIKESRPDACVSLSPNDNGKSSFCMCENCKKLDPPNAPKIKFRVYKKVGQSARTTIDYPSLSDRYVWYWNQVAERVARVHPRQLFLVDAYSIFSSPPVREKLHPNLVLRYIPSDTTGWTAWQQAGAKRIYWRPNILYFGSNEGTLNRFTAHELAGKMGALIDLNMIGTDMDCCFDNWSTMGLNYYVTAKMNWNPRLKYDAILEDYCRSGFGGASGEVRRYFERVEALRDPVKEELGAAMLEKYTPAAINELRGLLAAAGRAAAADPAVKQRLAFLERGLEFTAITAQAMRLRNDAEAGRPLDRAAAAQLMERRLQMMREIARQQPLAVNMPYVAGNEDYIWRPLQSK